MFRFYMSMLWVAVCVVPSTDHSLQPVNVLATVRSTAVLPCKLPEKFTEKSSIQWYIGTDLVFERKMNKPFVDEGFEGRVDVPLDELQKGNCSLILTKVKMTDTGVYNLYMKANDFTMKKLDRVSVNLTVTALQISARVGSTVILPCDWRNMSHLTPHVKWYTDREIVFERKGDESFPGGGYEGRVDVPKDELLKGNCSLVLKNFSITDRQIYSISIKASDNLSDELVVQTVELSVDDRISDSSLAAKGAQQTAVNWNSWIISMCVIFVSMLLSGHQLY